MPKKDSPLHEIQTRMSFNHFKMLKPNEYSEDYHIRKPNNNNILFQVKDDEYVYVGEKLINLK